ncbi:MAG TPA: hypothetical protein VGC55_04265 [Dokdonella sp.]
MRGIEVVAENVLEILERADVRRAADHAPVAGAALVVVEAVGKAVVDRARAFAQRHRGGRPAVEIEIAQARIAVLRVGRQDHLCRDGADDIVAAGNGHGEVGTDVVFVLACNVEVDEAAAQGQPRCRRMRGRRMQEQAGAGQAGRTAVADDRAVREIALRVFAEVDPATAAPASRLSIASRSEHRPETCWSVSCVTVIVEACAAGARASPTASARAERIGVE